MLWEGRRAWDLQRLGAPKREGALPGPEIASLQLKHTSALRWFQEVK